MKGAIVANIGGRRHDDAWIQGHINRSCCMGNIASEVTAPTEALTEIPSSIEERSTHINVRATCIALHLNVVRLDKKDFSESQKKLGS